MSPTALAGTAVVVTVQALHIAGHNEEALIEPNRMVPQSEMATFVMQSGESGVPLQRRGCRGVVEGMVVVVDVAVSDVVDVVEFDVQPRRLAVATWPSAQTQIRDVVVVVVVIVVAVVVAGVVVVSGSWGNTAAASIFPAAVIRGGASTHAVPLKVSTESRLYTGAFPVP